MSNGVIDDWISQIYYHMSYVHLFMQLTVKQQNSASQNTSAGWAPEAQTESSSGLVQSEIYLVNSKQQNMAVMRSLNSESNVNDLSEEWCV